MNYDSWKLATPTEYETDEPRDEEPTCDCGQPLDGGEDGLCVDCVREAREHAADCADASCVPTLPAVPPPGTWAATAREMARLFPDFDWDAWKDEMKEGDL